MADVVKVLLAGGAVGIVLVAIYVIYMTPDRAAVWGSWLWRLGATIFHRVDKKAVALHLEGRFNGMSTVLAGRAHAERAPGVKVQWVDKGETANQFIQQDRLVLRLEPHKNRDRNFVHGGMLVIAATFAVRGKRLLSQTQRRGVDLHAARSLFELASPSVANLFYEDILGPELDRDAKLVELAETLDRLDRAGLFFSVAHQELVWLGRRVYVSPRDGTLAIEAHDFFEFLARYAERPVGDESIPLSFQGRYFKCAIVIVARTVRRQEGDITPWVSFARSRADAGAEAIYLVGSAISENRAFMDQIAANLCGSNLTHWAEQFREEYPSELVGPDGKVGNVRNYMISLRTRRPTRYERRPSPAPQPEPADPSVLHPSVVQSDTATIGNGPDS